MYLGSKETIEQWLSNKFRECEKAFFSLRSIGCRNIAHP